MNVSVWALAGTPEQTRAEIANRLNDTVMTNRSDAAFSENLVAIRPPNSCLSAIACGKSGADWLTPGIFLLARSE